MSEELAPYRKVEIERVKECECCIAKRERSERHVRQFVSVSKSVFAFTPWVGAMFKWGVWESWVWAAHVDPGELAQPGDQWIGAAIITVIWAVLTTLVIGFGIVKPAQLAGKKGGDHAKVEVSNG